MKRMLMLILVGLLAGIPFSGCSPEENSSIGVAVEFTDHAACAYVSQDKGWFEEAGLELTAYESYVTGMALASALARGDIQVAYICLVPAINAYANAGVPIKIVAGTHKYGYGLVVNPDKIKTVGDLEQQHMRIGCVREGGSVDVLLHKMIDAYDLKADSVLSNIQRMNPPKQVLAIKMGELDAAFLPEHWATMAEDLGFQMLLMSQDVWPDLQGSVLVAKEDMIRSHPDAIGGLVRVSQKATDWINLYPREAAEVVTRQLESAEGDLLPAEVAGMTASLGIAPDVVLHSMDRMDYTTNLDPAVIQEVIHYMAELGYIQNSFGAEDILDLSFLEA